MEIIKNMKKEKFIEKLKKELKEKDKQIKKLLKLVYLDDLTGLCNRRGFYAEALKFISDIKKEKELASIRKVKRSISIKNLTLLFIDVNNFKEINDKYGHNVGDGALKGVAKVLFDSVRDIDIISRWSGDEFVIALIGEDLENSKKTIDRINKKMGKSIKNKKYENLSLSTGASSIFEEDRKPKFIWNLDKLIKIADERMYKNKKQIKGRR